MTLYPVFMLKYYLIYWDANGGSVDAAVGDLRYMDLYGVLPIPEREGYVFTGWFTDDGRSEPLGDDVIVQSTENYTLYAGFSLRGDLDGNGRISSRDVSLFKRYISGGVSDSEVVYINCDVDGNGTVNARDLARLKRLLVDQ